MRPELHIAWRYLFSKKGHNAINIVSGVSAAAVGVVTAAMVCVLSVMNGFGALVEHMFSEFDPEIRITAAEGKSFQLDTLPVQQALALPFVQATSEVVEEMALVRYKDHQQPARVMGVDSVFQQITHIDTIITDGYFSVFDGAFDRCVMGRGLATQIGVNAHFVGAVHLYAPKRLERVNMLRPDEAFLHEKAFMAGTFAVNQTSYDDQLLLVSLPLARRLFQYDTLTVTALELQLDSKGHFSARQMKAQLRECLGEGYVVADRYEQQSDFFRILKIEKLLTALLLAFILLIACFNVIGSLSMLIIDKQDDICILRHLGATPQIIRRIFLCEGWFIIVLGAVFGLVIGLTICLLQQHLGLLKLGSGTDYVISAYPVLVQAVDVLAVAVIVLGMGFLAAWYATRTLRSKE
ncbi:MAG: FtsX-like permease family protein [Paludibacteraceae bacterium]|nr:FtsX-like permease family protein [Paludibacteraceae bacterium]